MHAFMRKLLGMMTARKDGDRRCNNYHAFGLIEGSVDSYRCRNWISDSVSPVCAPCSAKECACWGSIF